MVILFCIVKYLVEKLNVDKESQNNNGYTPLHYPCEGHLEVVQYLVGKQNVNKELINNFVYTPLHCPSSSGYLNDVKFLCEDGVNKNGKDLYF